MIFKIKECRKFMKVCSKCGELKLIKKSFYKNNRKKDVYNQECLECRNNRY